MSGLSTQSKLTLLSLKTDINHIQPTENYQFLT